MDILLPPLLTILRSSFLPTTLRTSALSILAQCVATNSLALDAYVVSLTESCLELIQLESVAAQNTSIKGNLLSSKRSVADENKRDVDYMGDLKQPAHCTDIIDSDPMTRDAKAAPLRRTALHFLSQLLRSGIASLYDSRSTSTTVTNVTLNIKASQVGGIPTRDEALPALLLKRMSVVIGYVAATDDDGVARVMAKEVLELVGQYREASIGF